MTATGVTIGPIGERVQNMVRGDGTGEVLLREFDVVDVVDAPDKLGTATNCGDGTIDENRPVFGGHGNDVGKSLDEGNNERAVEKRRVRLEFRGGEAAVSIKLGLLRTIAG